MPTPSPYAEHVRLLQESFQLFDLDRNGRISAAELLRMLGRLGQPLSSAQARAIVADYDLNGDGEIEFAEFLAHQLRTLDGQPAALKQAFAVDGDRDGVVDRAELRQALRLLWDGQLADADLEALAAEADADGDGRCTLGEIVSVITNSP